MSFKTIKTKLAALEPIFLQILATNNVNWEDRIQRAMVFHRLPITQLPEYVDVIKAMRQEPSIIKYNGKLLSVGGSGSAVGIDRFIMGFLSWAAQADNELDFDQRFASFQEYFENGEVISLQSCYLFNFESDQLIVELPNSLRVRRLSLYESKALQAEQKLPFFSAHFMLERVSKLPIVTSSTNGNEQSFDQEAAEQAIAHIQAAPEAFNKFVICLRVLQNAAVFVDGTTFDKFEGFAEQIHGGSKRWPFSANPMIHGEPFHLDKESLHAIEEFFALQSNKVHKKFSLACRRLSFASERNQLEDRVLDLCIALEALFLPDNEAELVFRLRMRLGKTLGKDLSDALALSKFVKDFYEHRSKVVHGGELPSSIDDDVQKAEGLLRQALRRYMKNPSAFSDQALNELLLS